MKKLNLLGENIVEYKKELQKEHSPLVKQSLKLAIEQMVKASNITQEVFLALLDDEMNVEKFKSFLLQKSEFQKSSKELLEDYDMVAYDMINMFKKYDVLDMEMESKPEKERIEFIQTFSLSKEFATEYFLFSPEEITKLFQRKGFIEKFAILRLSRIFYDWTIIEEVKENLLKVNISEVYYNKDNESYNIDIQYQVNFELCENKTLQDDVVLEIVRLNESSKHCFETMM